MNPQIALQGVGGVNKQYEKDFHSPQSFCNILIMYLEYLIKQERLVSILSRDVFLKPVVRQQRQTSCEIIRMMLEYCSHENGGRVASRNF